MLQRFACLFFAWCWAQYLKINLQPVITFSCSFFVDLCCLVRVYHYARYFCVSVSTVVGAYIAYILIFRSCAHSNNQFRSLWHGVHSVYTLLFPLRNDTQCLVHMFSNSNNNLNTPVYVRGRGGAQRSASVHVKVPPET